MRDQSARNRASNETDELNPSLRGMAATLLRRRRLALGVFLPLAVAAVLVALLPPDRFESRLKILVRNSRADVIVTPERTDGPAQAAPAEVTEAEINSEIQLLTGRDVLLQVVRDNRLDETETSWLRKGGDDPAVRAERAARRLAKTLRVAPVKKSSLIDVSYEADSPQAAAAVLQRLADLYLEKHLRVHRPAGTHEFFAAQAAEAEGQWRAARASLSEYQRKMNVVSLAAEQDLNLRKMVEAKAGLLTTAAALSEVTRRVEAAERALDKLEPRVVTESRSLPYQQSVESLTTMLVEQRNRRTQLLTKFQPDDRLVREAERQIEDTSAALAAAQSQTAVEQSSNLNPLRQTMEAELSRARLEQVGLQAKRDTLAAQVREYEALLAKLEQGSAGYDDLTRRVKTLAENYQLYVGKRDEALVADALDRGRIANVSLAEAPTASPLPSSPNRLLNLALGLFIATFLSLAGVVAAELFSASARTPREAESPANQANSSEWQPAGYAD
jgi:polysaccharide biosynthesis protein PslE